MSLTITLNEALTNQLEARAASEDVTAEELVVKMITEAIGRRTNGNETWRQKNQRRAELIRKSNRNTLSGLEHDELQQLQSELDRRLENSDCQLLDELTRMEEAVARLPSDE